MTPLLPWEISYAKRSACRRFWIFFWHCRSCTSAASRDVVATAVHTHAGIASNLGKLRVYHRAGGPALLAMCTSRWRRRRGPRCQDLSRPPARIPKAEQPIQDVAPDKEPTVNRDRNVRSGKVATQRRCQRALQSDAEQAPRAPERSRMSCKHRPVEGIRPGSWVAVAGYRRRE